MLAWRGTENPAGSQLATVEQVSGHFLQLWAFSRSDPLVANLRASPLLAVGGPVDPKHSSGSAPLCRLPPRGSWLWALASSPQPPIPPCLEQPSRHTWSDFALLSSNCPGPRNPLGWACCKSLAWVDPPLGWFRRFPWEPSTRLSPHPPPASSLHLQDYILCILSRSPPHQPCTCFYFCAMNLQHFPQTSCTLPSTKIYLLQVRPQTQTDWGLSSPIGPPQLPCFWMARCPPQLTAFLGFHLAPGRFQPERRDPGLTRWDCSIWKGKIRCGGHFRLSIPPSGGGANSWKVAPVEGFRALSPTQGKAASILFTVEAKKRLEPQLPFLKSLKFEKQKFLILFFQPRVKVLEGLLGPF